MRPSDPLLRFLRQTLDAKGHNTASVAAALGVPRAELRRRLTGEDPLTVDELLSITEVLGLTAADVGMLSPATSPVEGGALRPGPAEAPPHNAPPHETPEPSQFDNQPRALMKLAFDLGIDVMFLVEADALGDWGGPDAVRARYAGQELPIQLDAAYHRFMEPGFGDARFEVVLSFDKLYRCAFPWSAFRRVVFTPFPPPAPSDPSPPSTDEGEAPRAPFLRLVK